MKKPINHYRQHFPVMQYFDRSHQVYLDSAATSHKPQIVLDSINQFYARDNANPRRGMSTLSYRAEQSFEQSRQTIAQFINAKSANEIIITKNATEALNLVAFGYGLRHLKRGDEILVSLLEHHSNFVPWQMVAKQTGAVLKYISVSSQGQIDLADYERKLSRKTKIVAMSHLSNVFGTKSDLDSIIKSAHKIGAIVVVDGAQAVAHFSVDVQVLDTDFYAFSGHKMYAPLGVGVLFGKADLIDKMSPVQYGGGMIESVKKELSTFAPPPHRFEAGTGDTAATIGLKAAIEYIQSIGFDQIIQHEKSLIEYARNSLDKIDGVEVYGPSSAADYFGAISFNVQGIHPHDVAEVLDAHGVTVRAGHHCAMPLMRFLNVAGTVRISFGLYNNVADIDQATEAIKAAVRRFL